MWEAPAALSLSLPWTREGGGRRRALHSQQRRGLKSDPSWFFSLSPEPGAQTVSGSLWAKLSHSTKRPALHNRPSGAAEQLCPDSAAQKSGDSSVGLRDPLTSQNYTGAPLDDTVQYAFDTLFSGLRTGQSRTAQGYVWIRLLLKHCTDFLVCSDFLHAWIWKPHCIWMICPLNVIHEKCGPRRPSFLTKPNKLFYFDLEKDLLSRRNLVRSLLL